MAVFAVFAMSAGVLFSGTWYFSQRAICLLLTNAEDYVTMFYEIGNDPLVAMGIVGHANYHTTANIYTHLHDETLRRAYVNLEQVFSGEQAE